MDGAPASVVSEEASKEAASALKPVSFEELKKQNNDFTFVREPLPESVKGEDSIQLPVAVVVMTITMLTRLRSGETAENNNAQGKPGSLLRAMFPPTQPAKLVRLLMFIQHANKPAEKVEVDVPEDCNVGKVVEITKVQPLKVVLKSHPPKHCRKRTWKEIRAQLQ